MPTKRLPVVSLEVQTIDLELGGVKIKRDVVPCPWQQKNTSVNECLGCHHWHSLVADGVTGTVALTCEQPPEVEIQEVQNHVSLQTAPTAPTQAAVTAVSEIVNRNVLYVSPEMNIEDLAHLFIEKGIGGTIVTDHDGKAVGIVSKTDVVEARNDAYRAQEAGAFVLRPALRAQKDKTVQEIMTPFFISIPENMSVARASALMAYEGIHRLPVLNRQGQVTGLLTSLDVLRWFAEANGYALPQRSERK